MSTKILLDPILTARDVARCSTYIQFKTWAEGVLAAREDVFFYWLLPEFAENTEWLPKSDRVRYIKVPQWYDRTKEYITLSKEVDAHVAFNGHCWDYDILVTTRAGLASLMKMRAMSPRQKPYPWTKQVWIIENMPLMSFKGSVAVMDANAEDLFTLAGYNAADRVCVMSYHEKAGIMQRARDYFAPSVVKALDAKLKQTIPIQFDTFALKKPEFRFKRGGKDRFCIAYVGSLMKGMANLDKVYRVMMNHWVLKGDERLNLMVCTGKAGGPKVPPEQVKLISAPREEFWQRVKTEMHVCIMMYQEAGFLLSMMEPIFLGTPVICIDRPWARGQLGPDYPFYVTNEVQAYALVKAFYEDYEGMYAKFAAWHCNWLQPEYERRFKTDLLYTVLDGYLSEHRVAHDARVKDAFSARESNSIVAEVLKAVGDKKEFVLFDVLKQLGQDGVLYMLDNKMVPPEDDPRGVVWQTPWNDYRLCLKANHGWVDASTVTGHLKRAE